MTTAHHVTTVHPVTTAHPARLRAPGETRPGGRTARTRQAVLAAVFEELGEGGFAELTMEKAAQRSGIHVATLYRRWRCVEGLVCALLTDLSDGVPLPDTGTLYGDLRAMSRSLAAFYEEPRMRRLIEAVVSAAARHPEAATVLRSFFEERLPLSGRMVERAAERGEVPPDTDPVEVMSALGAPFYYRMLIVRRPVDAPLAESAATAVWAAARAGAYARKDGGGMDGGGKDGGGEDGRGKNGGGPADDAAGPRTGPVLPE